MAAFNVLAFVLLAGTACSALPNRIVGGTPATIEQYPSMVQVDFRGTWSGIWGHGCAANILNSLYVLSAAHCFEGWFYSPEYRRIRAGATYRESGGVIIYVAREHNHPSYGTVTFDGDITVVRLASSLVYTPAVQQGAIISQDAVIPDNMPVVHAGWGDTAGEGMTSPVLLDVTVFTINNTLCRERHAETPISSAVVTENMICSGILDVGGKDACDGDSGGPLYYGDILIGVVSWGRGCAQARFPRVNTRVASYTNWIVDVVNSGT